MTKTKLNIGLIGAGRIGKIHADHLLSIPEAELVAIAESHTTPELEQWIQARPIRRGLVETSDILSDPSIDAVFICSSSDTHPTLIREAALAGKAIFCEKPVSMSVEQTEEALKVVRATGVQLQIGFNRRFDHNAVRLLQHRTSGALGDIHAIRITSRDPHPPHEYYIQHSGGLFMDMAIHDFDMARYLVGSEITEVYARGEVLIDPVFAKYNDIDSAVTVLTFANGALGVIENSRKAAYGYDQRIELFGSKGMALSDNDRPSTVQLNTGAHITSDHPHLFFLERYADAFREEDRRFVQALLNGEAVPVSGEDGLIAQQIAEAARRSLDEKRPVACATTTSNK